MSSLLPASRRNAVREYVGILCALDLVHRPLNDVFKKVATPQGFNELRHLNLDLGTHMNTARFLRRNSNATIV